MATKTIELTVSPSYVKDWGVWEGVRELLQNALDAHDNAHDMSVLRSKTEILISNEGVTLDRSALLLGTTSKGDGSARGKFGEGLKLAFLALCRLGIVVQVKTGNEIWTPFIEASTTFGKDLLKVKISTSQRFRDGIDIRILGVKDEDWAKIEQNLVDIPGLTNTATMDKIPVRGSKILTGDKYKGKVFARGLFVCEMDRNAVFGYDLFNIALDRDRKMADPISMRYGLHDLFLHAFQDGAMSAEQVYQVVSEMNFEAKCLGDYYFSWGSDGLSKAVAKVFQTKHGEDALPISSMAESMEAEHLGLRGVPVMGSLKQMIEAEIGDFKQRKLRQESSPKKIYGWGDLDEEERLKLTWASSIIDSILTGAVLGLPLTGSVMSKVEIVDFHGSPYGTYDPETGTIRIARKVLKDKVELMATLVHEIAHRKGLDGSVSHERQIEKLFAILVCGLRPCP